MLGVCSDFYVAAMPPKLCISDGFWFVRSRYVRVGNYLVKAELFTRIACFRLFR